VPTPVTHLLLAPGLSDTLAVEHAHDSLPVIAARERCLYDHLQRLQDLLERIGVHARIPLGEEALTAVEP
jgi:hypothetical protein